MWTVEDASPYTLRITGSVGVISLELRICGANVMRKPMVFVIWEQSVSLQQKRYNTMLDKRKQYRLLGGFPIRGTGVPLLVAAGIGDT